jgi:hypothetical protein
LLAARYGDLLPRPLTCLPHNHLGLLDTDRQPNVPKVVRIAEEYLEANADKPLRMDDLARVVGMGPRSIQLAFRRPRGYSPSPFLRACRLIRARHMLTQAAPGTDRPGRALTADSAPKAIHSLQPQTFRRNPLRNHPQKLPLTNRAKHFSVLFQLSPFLFVCVADFSLSRKTLSPKVAMLCSPDQWSRHRIPLGGFVYALKKIRSRIKSESVYRPPSAIHLPGAACSKKIWVPCSSRQWLWP